MGLDEKVAIFTHFSTSVSHPSLFMTPFRLFLLRFVAAVSRPLLSEMPLWLCFVVLNNWHDLGALLHGTVPVAEALLAKGALLGTVLSFMMAVTTLSVPSLILLRKAVKPKLLGIFAAICTMGTIIVGYFFNAIQYLLI